MFQADRYFDEIQRFLFSGPRLFNDIVKVTVSPCGAGICKVKHYTPGNWDEDDEGITVDCDFSDRSDVERVVQRYAMTCKLQGLIVIQEVYSYLVEPGNGNREFFITFEGFPGHGQVHVYAATLVGDRDYSGVYQVDIKDRDGMLALSKNIGTFLFGE